MDVRGISAFCKASVVLPVCVVWRLFKRRQLWLISDRVDKGGDNGEVLFLHLRKYHPEIDVRFVVEGNSPTARRLRQHGAIVPWHSWRRKLFTLMADCLISSQAQGAFVNPFGDWDFPYRAMLKKIPFVFLQHGVIKDDMSEELNRKRRRISGFITSARRERESIVNGNYGYGSKQIWLTGLPRFDILQNSPKKRILVMPTWRRSLMTSDGEKLKEQDFVLSEYFSFYNNLINNGSLLDECRRWGYRIILKMHPNFKAGERFFQLNDVSELVKEEVSYAELFSSGNVLVTDYSSTAFDFAYLRKPVIYTQFDGGKIFAGGHSYKRGYYDYKKDGFGEVVTTCDVAVSTLIAYLRTNCLMKSEYRRRVDDFFAFDDRNCCVRVAGRIQEMLDANKVAVSSEKLFYPLGGM